MNSKYIILNVLIFYSNIIKSLENKPYSGQLNGNKCPVPVLCSNWRTSADLPRDIKQSTNPESKRLSSPIPKMSPTVWPREEVNVTTPTSTQANSVQNISQSTVKMNDTWWENEGPILSWPTLPDTYEPESSNVTESESTDFSSQTPTVQYWPTQDINQTNPSDQLCYSELQNHMLFIDYKCCEIYPKLNNRCFYMCDTLVYKMKQILVSILSESQTTPMPSIESKTESLETLAGSMSVVNDPVDISFDNEATTTPTPNITNITIP